MNIFSQVFKNAYVDDIYDCYIDDSGDENYVTYIYSKVYDKNNINIIFNIKVNFLDLIDFYKNKSTSHIINLNDNAYEIKINNFEIAYIPKKFMDDSYDILYKLWEDEN